MLWLIVAIPFAVYLAILVRIYLQQDRLLFPATRGPIDVAASGVPEMRAVTLLTADGLTLTAWYKPASQGRPTLLYFHGNGGDIADRTARMRFFDSLGWGELFPEYRGYGPNPGQPSQTGFYLDADAAYEFLISHNVSGDQIILYGESLGTGVAVHLATRREVAAVILDSPYASIAAVAQAHFPYLPVGLLLRNKFPLLSLIDEIHAPLLVMQGALDYVVPPEQGQAVFAAAAAPKQFWSGPQTYHCNVLETGGAAAVKAFVAEHR